MEEFVSAALQLFGRHFVGLQVRLRAPATSQDPDHIHSDVYSGWVLRIDDSWFWITAGHVLQGLDESLDNGWSMEHCALIDLGEKHDSPIPFAYARSVRDWLDEDKGVDLGWVTLDDLYVRNLQANDIVAVDARAIASPEQSGLVYYVFGVPNQFTKFDQRPDELTVQFAPIPLRLNRLSDSTVDRVERMSFEVCNDTIVCSNETLVDITGMSGGPVICVYRTPEHEVRYKVIGVQSAWIPSKQIIYACPVHELVIYLRLTIMDPADLNALLEEASETT